jgi:hypothetical protein
MSRAPIGWHEDRTKLLESANLPHLREDKCMKIPGFIPPGNGGRILFLPSAIVVVDTRMQGGLKL